GVNDPNEARERVTHDYLKLARFIWLIFPAKRPPGKDLFQILKGKDLFCELLLDGKVGDLSFVGTASDDIDVDNAREELGLPDSAPLQDVLRARKQMLRDQIKDILTDIILEQARKAPDDVEFGKRLAEQLPQPAVFTVSALDFLLFGRARRRRLM